TTGCLCKGKIVGRPRVSEENVQRVRDAFVRSPKKSVRKDSRELAMPVMTVWKVLRKRPNRLQLLQALKPTDYAVRSNFAHEMLHDHLISNLPELRDRIREAVVAVTPDMLIKV
ncbi:hypothetical protein C0J52_16348, partial [Blattella germanica]